MVPHADAVLGLLAMTVGMGGYFRNAALVQSHGQTAQVTKAKKWRLVAQLLGVTFALLALEFVFLIHSN